VSHVPRQWSRLERRGRRSRTHGGGQGRLSGHGRTGCDLWRERCATSCVSFLTVCAFDDHGLG
jgi:hypothetical protein